MLRFEKSASWFFFISVYVILMVFRVYLCEKNISHRDYSETGTISKYVSNMAFLYEIYRENTTFRSKFRFKKTNSWNFETLLNICMGIIKWYLYGYFLNFSKRQMGGGGSPLKFWKRGYLKFWKCVKWQVVWSKMFRKQEKNAVLP